MSIYSINVIANEDVINTFGFSITETTLVHNPEDGEYIYVRLDDDMLDELAEELEWETEHGDDIYAKRLYSSIFFIENMRNHYGLDVEVLVHYYT
jgi:hypothetical protein